MHIQEIDWFLLKWGQQSLRTNKVLGTTRKKCINQWNSSSFSFVHNNQQATALAGCHRTLTAAGKNYGFSFSLDLDIMREEHWMHPSIFKPMQQQHLTKALGITGFQKEEMPHLDRPQDVAFLSAGSRPLTGRLVQFLTIRGRKAKSNVTRMMCLSKYRSEGSSRRYFDIAFSRIGRKEQ